MAIASVYLPNPIWISDRLGANTVGFGSLSEPSTIPQLKEEGREKSYFMRVGPPAEDGENKPGNRVWWDPGSQLNYADLEFVAPFMTPLRYARLLVMYRSRNRLCIYSPDAGTTRYLCKFASGGLVPDNYPKNLAVFFKCSIRLHVLGVATTVMASPVDGFGASEIGGTDPDPPPTPLALTSSSPVDGGSDFPVEGQPTLVFNQLINFTDSTFEIARVGGGSVPAGTWNNNGIATAWFSHPGENFVDFAGYIITYHAVAVDEDVDPLDGTITFTVGGGIIVG